MESRENVEKYGLSVGTRLKKNKNTSKVESQSNIRKLESAKSTVRIKKINQKNRILEKR